MDSTTVFVHYDGSWDKVHNYNGFKVMGLLIPNNCSFIQLLDILSKQLRINQEEATMQIKYQVKEAYPALQIEDDENLLFYLQLKKKEVDDTKYPLCITNIEKHQEPNYFESISRVSNLQLAMVEYSSASLFEHMPTNYAEKATIVDFMDFANSISKEIIDERDRIIERQEGESEREDSSIITNSRHAEIQNGQLYRDKDTLKSALSFYAISNHFQYKVIKSCPRQYSINCLDDSCKWFLRASRSGKTSMYIIRKFNNIHTCPLETRMSAKRQATPSIVGECIKSKFLDVKTIYTAIDVVRDIQEEYGVRITYSKAWRSREKALEMIRGKPEESYEKIPSYLYMLMKTNPGSITGLKMTENSNFLYVFVALEASISGWKYCKPVIVVDGTFLKATHGGTLLIACTEDAGGKIFPLAFSVVDSENDASWEWFMEKMKHAFGERKGLCIVSDRNESIEKACRNIFPEASHGFCIFHLLNNLKTKFKKNTNQIKDPFFAAAKSYTLQQFNYHMEQLDKADKRIRPYLINVGYNRWSRLHSTNNRYSIMTSNIAESMNATNKATRDLPISTLLECLRSLVQDWSWKNRNIALSTFTRLTNKAEKVMAQNYIHSLKLKVKPSTGELYTVTDNDKSIVVNVKERTCLCNRFQIDGLPCAHALAIFREMNLDPITYCSEYHKKETLVSTYASTVYPIGNQSTWEILDEVKEIKVLPPEGKIKAGRPKKRRIKGAWENKLQIRCGRCGQKGHNRKTCRNLPKK